MKHGALLRRLQAALPKPRKPCAPILLENPQTGLFHHDDKTYTLAEARAAFDPKDFSCEPVFLLLYRTEAAS